MKDFFVKKKVSSIKELEKWVSDRIELIEDNAVHDQRQPTIEEYEIIEALKLVLVQVKDLVASVRERIELFSAEKTSEKTTAKFLRNVFLDIRLEELRKVFGGDRT